MLLYSFEVPQLLLDLLSIPHSGRTRLIFLTHSYVTLAHAAVGSSRLELQLTEIVELAVPLLLSPLGLGFSLVLPELNLSDSVVVPDLSSVEVVPSLSVVDELEPSFYVLSPVLPDLSSVFEVSPLVVLVLSVGVVSSFLSSAGGVESFLSSAGGVVV